MAARTCLFLLLVGSVACKSERTPERRPPPTPVASADAATADAAPAKVPITDGMVCFRRWDAWHWAASGAITKFEGPISFASEDGHAFQLLPESADARIRLETFDDPVQSFELPPAITMPPQFMAIASATSALAVRDDKAYILAGGTWVERTAPARAFSLSDAIDHDGTWWIANGSGFAVDDGTAFVDAPLADTREITAGGFIRRGGKTFAVYRAVDYKGAALYEVELVGRAFGKAARLAESNRYGQGLQIVRGPGDAWAAWDHPKLLTALDGGRPTLVDRETMGIVAIDGAKRLWLQTTDSIVAVEPGGTEQAYGATTNELFAYDLTLRKPTRCAPVAAGFATLPAAGAVQQGELAVDVDGASSVPFILCTMANASACVGAQDHVSGRIAGTLDATGHWSGTVPIGTYHLAVQIGGEWLVPEMSAATNTARWFCQVEPNKPCAIKVRTR